MTRPTPAPLATVLAGSAPLVGECLILAAKDGTRAGFTTLDTAQSVDLGLGAGAESCASGMVLSAVTLSVGLDASFAEVSGPLGPVLTPAAVDGGKWDDADAWLVQVSPGTAGFAPLLRGKVREARSEDLRFVLEVRNQADALNQSRFRQLTPFCTADFGDAECGYPVVPVAATVTAVTDAMRFSVSLSGTFANGFFNRGKATFTSGALNGVVADNVFAWTSGGAGAGSLVLFEPLAQAPGVGDTLELRQGCAKIRKSGDPAVPTCLGYANVLNFRGYPDVPGSDQVLRYPNPGGAA